MGICTRKLPLCSTLPLLQTCFNSDAGMATQLQKLLRSSSAPAGLDPALKVYNRSQEKTKQLTDNPELGATAVNSPAELAGCAITFVMLAEDTAVEQASCNSCKGYNVFMVPIIGSAGCLNLLVLNDLLSLFNPPRPGAATTQTTADCVAE